MDICPQCGHDYRPYPQYRDFIHFVHGTDTPCIELTEEQERSLNKIVNEMVDQMDRIFERGTQWTRLI